MYFDADSISSVTEMIEEDANGADGNQVHMSHDARKPVFRVSDQV